MRLPPHSASAVQFRVTPAASSTPLLLEALATGSVEAGRGLGIVPLERSASAARLRLTTSPRAIRQPEPEHIRIDRIPDNALGQLAHSGAHPACNGPRRAEGRVL
jgi:hypothetical protein